MEVQSCYKVGGSIFNTLEEATNYSSKLKDESRIKEENITNILRLKTNKKEALELKYDNLGIKHEVCRCEHKDYSSDCLRHLCTCEIEKDYPQEEYRRYVCNHHTNIGFKNKGCFYCRHSDCSMYNC